MKAKIEMKMRIVKEREQWTVLSSISSLAGLAGVLTLYMYQVNSQTWWHGQAVWTAHKVNAILTMTDVPCTGDYQSADMCGFTKQLVL